METRINAQVQKKINDAIAYLKLYGYEVIKKEFKVCKYCGEKFTVDVGSQQVFCSSRCNSRFKMPKYYAKRASAQR